MKYTKEKCMPEAFGEIAFEMKQTNLCEMFSADPDRFNKYSIKYRSIFVDFSKNFINEKFCNAVKQFAEELHLKDKIDSMFDGEIINTTEKRAVLHTALRNYSCSDLRVSDENVMPKIVKALEHIREFVDGVRSGKIRSSSDEKFTDIVNIGIGGSDLGPAMVCEALKRYSGEGLRMHFVSNVDSADITEKLRGLPRNTTLFVISSKTFTTQETMRNAITAKKWFKLQGKLEIDIAMHFVAVTTNRDNAAKFGIDPKNIFEFWDWVGGRYSLWSSIGLSIALFIGYENFAELLAGGAAMDSHFRTAPFDKNLPVMMAMIGAYYNEYFDAQSQAVIPYDQYLSRFPAFLQQLDMESNGKSVTKNNEYVKYKTGQIIWGEPGTNAQHSFFQLLHQGTRFIPVDFIGALKSIVSVENHREILLANMFAQSEALMNGKTEEAVRAEMERCDEITARINELVPHRSFAGNKPSTTILLDKLTPRSLGELIAMYEHKVYVQGVIWNVNSFDQWGVELGKQLVVKILPEIHDNEEVTSHDSSTNGLLNYYIRSRSGD